MVEVRGLLTDLEVKRYYYNLVLKSVLSTY